MSARTATVTVALFRRPEHFARIVSFTLEPEHPEPVVPCWIVKDGFYVITGVPTYTLYDRPGFTGFQGQVGATATYNRQLDHEVVNRIIWPRRLTYI